MGKSDLHVVVVRRGVLVALLLLTSAAILALVWFLSGKAYVGESHALADVMKRLFGSDANAPSNVRLLAALMPQLADVLVFVPWGFFMFLSVDRSARSRSRSYALTLLAGLLFVAGIVFWQYRLPTRVTGFADGGGNLLGVFCGALLGHLRKQVRIRFE